MIGAIVLFVIFRILDGRWRYAPYTLAFTLTLSAILFLFTRRVLFSLISAGTLVLLLGAMSVVKSRLRGMSLHVYDFVFTGLDTSVIRFLALNYTSLALSALAVLALSAGGLVFVFRWETPLESRWLVRVPAILAFFGLTYAAHPANAPQEVEFLPRVSGLNASSLPLSVWNLPDLFRQSPLAARIAPTPKATPLPDVADCGPDRNAPDIFVVLAESQASPLSFPQLAFPQAVTESLRSGDRTIKPLYVETFGAGTWMSNFSVLTGLSTADFGWQAAYVTQLLEGRIRGALPELLARCGYRTVTVLPMEATSLNEGAFLRSIGFQEVIDAGIMGRAPMTVRDKYYLDHVATLVEEHRRTDPRPLFVAVQTLFAHAPYKATLLPDPAEVTPTYDAGAEINEYMRRITIARADLRAFLDGRARSPGQRGTVVLEFGDHQSSATLDLMLARFPGKPLMSDYRSEIYETYYAVHGYGAAVDYKLLDQAEDLPYIAARLIAAAGLPVSPKYADLLRLSTLCGGRFHTCANRTAVDAHLKGLTASGLLRLD